SAGGNAGSRGLADFHSQNYHGSDHAGDSGTVDAKESHAVCQYPDSGYSGHVLGTGTMVLALTGIVLPVLAAVRIAAMLAFTPLLTAAPMPVTARVLLVMG